MEESLRQQLLAELNALDKPIELSSEDTRRIARFTANMLSRDRPSLEVQYLNAQAISDILLESARAKQP